MRHGLAKTVPDELRAELARRRLGNRQLAELIGDVNEMWVWRRLSGRVEISLTDLERITSALEIDLSALVAGAA